jgi:hypothetical protein
MKSEITLKRIKKGNSRLGEADNAKIQMRMSSRNLSEKKRNRLVRKH